MATGATGVEVAGWLGRLPGCLNWPLCNAADRAYDGRGGEGGGEAQCERWFCSVW